MSARKIYAIANSHLDPVWLWTRASGQNSMINTARSVVRILKEYPKVKFTCSSSSLYRWCESSAPDLFEQILELVAAGQWEPVGGWEVQSDSIITRLEILLRQAEFGQTYFESHFGKKAAIAYNVDSFGHTAMLPAILNRHGFTHYVYGRGQELPALFRWIAPDGSSVIAHHFRDSYGSAETMTKEQFISRLRDHWEHGDELQTFFYGLGDHGGGIYRKHIEWIEEASSEIPVSFSTLKDFFRDSELQQTPLPEFSGEIAGCSRAIYSTGHEVKKQAARAMRHLLKAERIVHEANLEIPWRELIFNHFHDIVPGTSIRKAFENDVFPSLGYSDFSAQSVLDAQLAKMESEEDLSFIHEGGVQIWNPHPFTIQAILSIDGFTDPNATGENFHSLISQTGKTIPLQILPAATSYGPFLSPWGKLTAVVSLPPMSQEFLAYSRKDPSKETTGFLRSRALLEKISFPVFYDNNGSWGFHMLPYGLPEEYAILRKVTELSDGPVCSLLAADYEYRSSTIRLELTVWKTIEEIGVQAHILWNERFSCLKFAIDLGKEPDSVATGNAGGITKRRSKNNGSGSMWTADGRIIGAPCGTQEYAFTDFCAAVSGKNTTAVYAPDLYSCDYSDRHLRISLLRPARYADFVTFPANDAEGWMDIGFSHLSFWVLDSVEKEPARLPRTAEERLLNAEIREITGHPAGRKHHIKRTHPFDLANSFCVATSIRENTVTLWNPSDHEEILRLDNKEHRIPPFAIRTIDRLA